MLIALHKNATAAPATRLALQQARGADRELAQQYDIGVDTVSKQDGSVRQSLLGSCAQGYSIQDSHHPHRQW